MMLRVLPLAVGVATFAGCAHVEPPPGGPEDKTPPQLLVSRPASNGVVPDWSGPVVLAFDERVSERGVDQAVEVSPRTSAVVVGHSGDEIRVRLREGWRPGTIYHINVLPELRDLFGNALVEPIRFVFSTGPEIPDTRVEVVALDRITAQRATDVRVEAMNVQDSLVYTAYADTSELFTVTSVPVGTYEIRAFEDLNRNRAIDPFEPSDSREVSVGAGDTTAVRLSVVAPDTVPPRVAEASIQERVITVTFDDHLDPTQPLTLGRVSVTDSAGAVQPISRMGIGTLPPLERPEQAPRDESDEPLPASQRLLIELAPEATLASGPYTVTVQGIRNIVGLSSRVEATVEVTEPAAETPPEAPSESTDSVAFFSINRANRP